MPSSRSRRFGVSPVPCAMVCKRSRCPRLPSHPWPPRPPSAPAPGCPTGRARPRRCCARSAAGRATRRSAHEESGRIWRAMRTPEGPATLCVQPQAVGRRGPRPGLGAGSGVGARPDAGAAGRRRRPVRLRAAPPPRGRGRVAHPPALAHRAHRAGDGVAGALDPRAEGHRQAGVRLVPRARTTPRRARARPRRAAAADAAADPGHDRRDPVVGVAAPRRPARPVAHHGHRLPAGVVPRAGGRGVGRRGRPAAGSIRGVGVWTSAEVRQRALGDPDAVSFGDYHLANWVGWALVGHDITDEEMAELLEPYRPQRGRAAAMAMAGGQVTAAARSADERPDAPPDPLTGRPGRGPDPQKWCRRPRRPGVASKPM